MLSRILSRTTHLRLLSHLHSPPPCSSQIPKLPFFTHYRRHHRRHFSTNDNDDNDRNPASNIWKISQQPTDDLEDLFGPGEIDPYESEKPKPNPKPRPNPADGQWVLGETDAGTGGEDLWSMEAEAGGVGVESEKPKPKPRPRPNPADGQWVLGETGAGADTGTGGEDLWSMEADAAGGGVGGGGGGRSEKAGGFEAWSFGPEAEEGKEGKELEELLEIEKVETLVEDEKSREEREMMEAAKRAQLEKEKQSLLDVIQGPNLAFGDLIAASGLTDAMIDSLIALKNFEDIQGLPLLEQIEDQRYEKTLQKSSRYEIELQKQEEIAKGRVRKVDEQGRAYGTGKRKTSIARVWIQPGEGKFCINDKEFDVYFPMLDHRATLLRPFVETKTLGLWDVRCTVKGGGSTGQVEAIRLGISRALQNWEPGFRRPLKDVGFLTRDPRIVERKKPGRAKARKSFQWVKR